MKYPYIPTPPAISSHDKMKSLDSFFMKAIAAPFIIP
jgi:hypothetical protein